MREAEIGERWPDIPEWVDVADLDDDVRRDLRSLSKENSAFVGAHLIAAGTLADEDPEPAWAHARAARSKGGRIAVVRETAGLVAYRAGEWSEAISELRAARRLGGGAGHLAVLADCERALGHPEKAIEIARSAEAATLEDDEKIELTIVVAGARADLGQLEAALVSLEATGLLAAEPRPDSARIYFAYADLLEQAGRRAEALDWFMKAADVDPDEETEAGERLTALAEAGIGPLDAPDRTSANHSTSLDPNRSDERSDNVGADGAADRGAAPAAVDADPPGPHEHAAPGALDSGGGESTEDVALEPAPQEVQPTGESTDGRGAGVDDASAAPVSDAVYDLIGPDANAGGLVAPANGDDQPTVGEPVGQAEASSSAELVAAGTVVEVLPAEDYSTVAAGRVTAASPAHDQASGDDAPARTVVPVNEAAAHHRAAATADPAGASVPEVAISPKADPGAGESADGETPDIESPDGESPADQGTDVAAATAANDHSTNDPESTSSPTDRQATDITSGGSNHSGTDPISFTDQPSLVGEPTTPPAKAAEEAEDRGSKPAAAGDPIDPIAPIAPMFSDLPDGRG